MKTPMKAPTGPLHWNADCHDASIINSPFLSLYTPKLLANSVVAMNCPIKKTQYDSMIYRRVREMTWLQDHGHGHGQELTMVLDMTNAHQLAEG